MDRRELLILRHAKSAWDTDAPADFDRPLAPRGRDAASRMGRYLVEAGLTPDAVVCSSAVRAVQTVHRVARAAGLSLRGARFEGGIYEAGLPALLGVLGGCAPGARRTMIVGHNPGLEDLLDHLAGGVPVPAGGKLLPTAALARLALPDDWRRLGRGCGELVALTRVRDLAGRAGDSPPSPQGVGTARTRSGG